jgi:DNA-binding NarL/FixJ family response regulator/signal transduction histidine kinase
MRRVGRQADAAGPAGRYRAAMRTPDAPWRRLRAAGPWALDGLLAVAAAGAGVVTLASVLPFDPGSPRSVAAYLLVLAHTLPLAVRRRFPLPALAWALATGVAFASLGLNLVSLSLALLIYLYTVAARCPRRRSVAALAASEALLAGVFLVRPRSIGDGGTLLLDCLIVAAAWWLGDGTRRRQEAVRTAQERAAELELAREELARRAVTEERLRIARELHDVVAHSMSIIAVQSGVGVHVLDSRPEEARNALVAVEATSRQALVEMRRLLGVLRQDAEPAGSLSPAPGLAEVEALAAEVARTGVRVEVRIEGTRPELPIGLDLTAYRIVQEALTNVVRHAARRPRGSGSATPPASWPWRWSTTGAVPPARRRPRRPRHRGDARARLPVRRHAGGRPPAGRRLPRRRHPAAGGRPVTTQVTRVLVADDQTLVRAGFRVLIESAPDLEVVGEAGDGVEAVELARQQLPDVVLMDIRMPRLDGLEATRRIAAMDGAEGVRVLVLTTFDLDEYVYQALRAGASGFLLKDTPPGDLLAAIRVVAAGDALLAPPSPGARSPSSPGAPSRARSPRPRWPPSPTASGRCWPWWPGGCPTPRSPSGWW